MGGKTSTTTQTVKIPPEVMARYNAVNTRAEEVAKQPFQQYGGQFVAGLTDLQKAGMSGISAAADMAQPYYSQAADYTKAGSQDVGKLTADQIAQYQNPYTQSVIDPTIKALSQQQGQQLAQQQAQAIKSGGFGGDRAGIARATTMGQQDLARALTESGLRSKAYEQAVQTATGQQGVAAADLTRKLQAGQQIAGIGTGAQQAALQGAQAQIGAGTLEQQTQQADLTAKYQQFLQERGYPFQVAQFLANIAMGTGALSGSTTTTTQPSSFFSDERLKENVKPIGETFDGQTIYKYNDTGEPGTQIGLLAQDVERKHPEAVGLAAGFKTVNYDKATDEAAHRGARGVVPENWMGGAVEHPGSYARGGYALSGSVVDPLDMRSILEANRQSLSPFSMAGLYGGAPGQNPMGGMSYVPKAGLATPKLVTAGPVPRSPDSGFREAVAGMESAEKFGRAFTDEKGLFGEKGPIRTLAGKVGLGGAKTPEGGTQQTQRTGVAAGAPAAAPGGTTTTTTTQPPAAANQTVSSAEDVLRPTDDIIMPAARGGVIHPSHRLGYAGLGKVINPMEFQDPSKGIGAYIESATESQDDDNKLQTPGAPGGGGGQSGFGQVASAVGSAAGLASGLSKLAAFLPSDERLKDNIRPVGKTYDGQNIYSYDMGDGATRMGLMAQEVLKRDPEAVGQREGYLTLDYDRATQGAEGRYMGGVAPRMGYQEGGETPESIAEYQIMKESRGDPRIRATTSSAAGLGQFTDATARDVLRRNPQLVEGVSYDPSQRGFAATLPEPVQRQMVTAHTRHLMDSLKEQGFEPTRQNVRMSYFLGEAGGPAFLSALRENPNIPATQIAQPDQIRANQSVFFNKDGSPRSAGEVFNFLNKDAASAQPSGGVAPRERPSYYDYLPTRRNEKGEEQLNLKQILIPGLVGLGAMASSPSRYFGAAALQGLGAGAQAYANLEKQQQDIEASKAGTEKIYAEIPSSAYLTGPEGQVVGIRVYVNGKLTSVTPAEFARAQREGKPYSLTPRPGQPQRAPEKPAPKQSQEMEIGAVEGPAAPAAPGAPGAPRVQAPYRALPKEDQDLVTRNAEQVQQTGTTRLASSPSANPFDAQNAVASEALTGLGQRNMFAKALGEIPRNAAAVSSGKFSTDVATPVVSWVNSILSTVGAPPITSLSDLSNAEVARKISTQLATKQTTESGQRAYGALQQILTAIPTQANTPEGAANLIADIYQVQQREIDLNRYLMQARNVAETRTGLNRNESRYIGDGLVDNFSRRMEQKYAEEKKMLADLYRTPLTYRDEATGKVVKTYVLPYIAARAGRLPPDLQEKFVKQYGSEVLRYFSGQ